MWYLFVQGYCCVQYLIGLFEYFEVVVCCDVYLLEFVSVGFDVGEIIFGDWLVEFGYVGVLVVVLMMMVVFLGND